MPRLFVAAPLPELLAQSLALGARGIPGARFVSAENLHVTLQFIGDVDGGTARSIVDALSGLRTPAFTTQLFGSGAFPPRGEPRVLWLGVEDPAPWQALHEEVVDRLDLLGLEFERRRYIPHLTMARLKRAPIERVQQWLSSHALTRSESFAVDRVCLYSSILGPSGARYRIEAAAPLSQP